MWEVHLSSAGRLIIIYLKEIKSICSNHKRIMTNHSLLLTSDSAENIMPSMHLPMLTFGGSEATFTRATFRGGEVIDLQDMY